MPKKKNQVPTSDFDNERVSRAMVSTPNSAIMALPASARKCLFFKSANVIARIILKDSPHCNALGGHCNVG